MRLQNEKDAQLRLVIGASDEREPRFVEIIDQNDAEGAIKYWLGMLMIDSRSVPATYQLIRASGVTAQSLPIRPVLRRHLMLLDRVSGQRFDALVDHADGPEGRSCLRGPPPVRALPWEPLRWSRHVGAGCKRSPSQQREGNTMGAYCLRALIPSHTASVGEIMQVLWSDY